MLSRGCFFALLVLMAGQAAGGSDSWVLKGRVLDFQGRPVADAGISTVWNANGVPLEEILRIEKQGGDTAKLSVNEGQMEPWGANPTKTDAEGRFSYKMSWTNYFLLAIDKERKQGALIVVDPPHVRSPIDVKLVPLMRLHGTLRLGAAGQHPESTIVVARVPESDAFPLGFSRLAMCSSVRSRFEILLPPGHYELEASANVSGRRYELLPYRPVTLPVGRPDVDAGTLELTPSQPRRGDRIREAQAKGTWPGVDPAKLYGQPAPKWHAVDARGIAKHAQVSDFKGKWVLVYFWGPWCTPCLGKTLPALMEFYQTHKDQRDRFELVTVCSTEPEIKTMADLDRELKPVVEKVWHQELPFPVVLDNTLQTTENFGVAATKLLFDPAGRLVPGDEHTLAEKLKQTAPQNPKQRGLKQ
jgi:thiol-disulfide isomerase/thioredoxin